MPMNEEVRKAVDELRMWVLRSGDQLSECDEWTIIVAELTRLTEIADSVDPLVVRLGEVTTKLEAHTKMLADCFRMAGADPDGNEDWRIATDALRAVTDLRRDYDEVLDWQAKCEAANALLRDIKEWDVNAAQGTCLMVPHSLRSRIQAHLSEPRT